MRGTSPGSTRLSCRVLLDGREIARPMVLLADPDVDNQGRFTDDEIGRSMSAATTLAYGEALERLTAGEEL